MEQLWVLKSSERAGKSEARRNEPKCLAANRNSDSALLSHVKNRCVVLLSRLARVLHDSKTAMDEFQDLLRGEHDDGQRLRVIAFDWFANAKLKHITDFTKALVCIELDTDISARCCPPTVDVASEVVRLIDHRLENAPLFAHHFLKDDSTEVKPVKVELFRAVLRSAVPSEAPPSWGPLGVDVRDALLLSSREIAATKKYNYDPLTRTVTVTQVDFSPGNRCAVVFSTLQRDSIAACSGDVTSANLRQAVDFIDSCDQFKVVKASQWGPDSKEWVACLELRRTLPSVGDDASKSRLSREVVAALGAFIKEAKLPFAVEPCPDVFTLAVEPAPAAEELPVERFSEGGEQVRNKPPRMTGGKRKATGEATDTDDAGSLGLHPAAHEMTAGVLPTPPTMPNRAQPSAQHTVTVPTLSKPSLSRKRKECPPPTASPPVLP